MKWIRSGSRVWNKDAFGLLYQPLRLTPSSAAVIDLITTLGIPAGLRPAVAGCCVDVRQCRLPFARTTGS
eukprot:13963131-Heterocapsa_arctica.AAC.1